MLWLQQDDTAIQLIFNVAVFCGLHCREDWQTVKILLFILKSLIPRSLIFLKPSWIDRSSVFCYSDREQEKDRRSHVVPPDQKNFHIHKSN